MEQKLLPEHAERVQRVQEAASRNASWSTIIVIVVILAMIVTGALYAWGKRVADERAYLEYYKSQELPKY